MQKMKTGRGHKLAINAPAVNIRLVTVNGRKLPSPTARVSAGAQEILALSRAQRRQCVKDCLTLKHNMHVFLDAPTEKPQLYRDDPLGRVWLQEIRKDQRALNKLSDLDLLIECKRRWDYREEFLRKLAEGVAADQKRELTARQQEIAHKPRARRSQHIRDLVARVLSSNPSYTAKEIAKKIEQDHGQAEARKVNKNLVTEVRKSMR